MSEDVQALDWEATGVVQMGGVVVAGGGVFVFEFRSKSANVKAPFILASAGFGFGGSIGGASAPSPSQFYHGDTNMASPLSCDNQPFSLNDIDCSYGVMEQAGASAMYGYSLARIQSGWANPNFTGNISGFGIGVGLGAGLFIGIWKRIGPGTTIVDQS